MAHLDGRVALVSGASGGIGTAVVDRLVADGASVVRSDVRAPADGIVCDVRDEASCARAVSQVLASHGQLDILVNVAGIGVASLVGNLEPSVWREIIEVNLTGTFLLSQQALPALLRTKGSIVNMASVAGLRATPYNAAYCASKGGVILLTKSMAIELAPAGRPGQRSVPGLGGHPHAAFLHPPRGGRSGPSGPGCFTHGGVIEPAEVASAVAYLASDEAANVTGTTLVIDGGASA